METETPDQETLDLTPAPVPTPGDVANKAKDPEPEDKSPLTPEQYEAQLAKLRKENAGWRTKLREAEPIVKAHHEREEASKTEVQRAQEAAQKAEGELANLQVGYTRLELAAQYNVSPNNIDLIGSGSREEMEDRAARLGALLSTAPAPPPSNRPVEGLRPGASPEPPQVADNSYPADWGFTPPRQS